MYNALSSGSKGNCIIYLDTIAVDMGISYKMIEPYKKELQLVLLSHCHSDHLKLSTIQKLAIERPTLRFAGGEFLKEYLPGVKNFDILESGKVYDYDAFKISPVTLFHDVPNFGYRIFKDGKKIFHATDSAHLNNITALNYDLLAIEHNHSLEVVEERIKEKRKTGAFCYEIGAINSHLSEEQAKAFIFKNAGENTQVLRLHESSNNL